MTCAAGAEWRPGNNSRGTVHRVPRRGLVSRTLATSIDERTKLGSVSVPCLAEAGTRSQAGAVVLREHDDVPAEQPVPGCGGSLGPVRRCRSAASWPMLGNPLRYQHLSGCAHHGIELQLLLVA